jgi:hypothetical protein
VLVCGLAGAYLFYSTRSSTRTIDELLPGYSQQRARQTAILMGSMVATLMEWADTLKDPRAQALIIGGTSVLVALACFRVASLLDQPEADEPRRLGTASPSSTSRAPKPE